MCHVQECCRNDDSKARSVEYSCTDHPVSRACSVVLNDSLIVEPSCVLLTLWPPLWQLLNSTQDEYMVQHYNNTNIKTYHFNKIRIIIILDDEPGRWAGSTHYDSSMAKTTSIRVKCSVLMRSKTPVRASSRACCTRFCLVTHLGLVACHGHL